MVTPGHYIEEKMVLLLVLPGMIRKPKFLYTQQLCVDQNLAQTQLFSGNEMNG